MVHDPSFCYRGAGYQVEKGQTFPLLNGEGKVLTLSKDAEQLDVADWFSDGTPRFTGFTEYVVRTALSRLSFGKIWQPPVMVTAHVERATDFDWAEGIDKFPFLVAF